jgi:hypothetical protein
MWEYRDFVFYEGMQMQIGPSFRDYRPAEAYQEATQQFKGQPRLGLDGSLENYTAGAPFPMEDIDCSNDPDAGTKIMWNFDYQWEGDGSNAKFLYTYWDRGEKLPLYYQGSSKVIQLSHRVEPRFAKDGGDLLRRERRKYAFNIMVDAPFDSRGIHVLTFRYKSSDNSLSEADNDDTWVYVPTLHRTRRISAAQRTESISGTDFTLDDMASFGGVVPQYSWTCLDEVVVIAPTNTMHKAYPLSKDHNFGSRGLSFASDQWELRKAFKVRFTPKRGDHPYHHKDIYIDKDSAKALYSFAYDQMGNLWKIMYHNARWSEDHPDLYPGWEGVEKPRDLKNVGDVILNVQTGTGNRIEFWDSHGTPYLKKNSQKIFIGRVRKETSLKIIGGGH